jgi:hypothetical protein
MTEKTAEQLAAEAATTAQAAADKKAEADAVKAQKKADAEKAKLVAKQEREAKKHAAQLEKDAAKAATEAAKAGKDAEKQAKLAAAAKAKQDKIDAKAEKAAARAATKLPEQNGIRASKEGTIGAILWNLYSAASSTLGRPISFAEAEAEVTKAGLAVVPASIRAGYARWKKFHGLSGRIAAPVAQAVQAEPAA